MIARCDFRPIGVCEIYIFLLMCLGTVYYIWILNRWNEGNGKEDCLWVPALNFKEIQKNNNVTLRN